MSFSYTLKLIDQKIIELQTERDRIMKICNDVIIGENIDPIYRIFQNLKDLEESKDVLINHIHNKEL